MSARLTTTPHWITMQAAMVGAFMIVDSFGHYAAQTVHNHGPPAGRHKYPVALCRSMHKHAQRAMPAIRQAEEGDLIARRVGHAREVRSGCRAEPCPSARAALGRGLCLAVLFPPPRICGRSGPPARPAVRSWGAPRARQCGPCPPFTAFSSWVLAVPRNWTVLSV